ncbi:MAG: HTTM domain-containing protein [Nannocystaceae bacterium]|nr:HTTM domain-containing protein [bacterium]
MTGVRDIVAPAMPAERLAMLRILVGAYGVIYLFARIGAIVGSTRYPAAQFEPVGLSMVLEHPLPAWVVIASLVLAIVSGVAFTLGWRYRVMGPLFAAVFLWVLCYRNSWGMPFHTENLLVLHTVVLASGPSAEAWSMDARGTALPEASRRYGWVVVAMCWATALTYFVAGWAKLSHSGLEWVTSDTLRNFIAYDNIRKAELGAGYSTLGTWMVAHAWVFPPLAAVSLTVELAAPLSVLNRRLGMIWCVAAWGFHVGVLGLMYILFHYPILGVAYASYFPVETLGRRILARVRR